MMWEWSLDPLAILAVGWGITHAVRKLDKKFATFKTDWEGTPERPGVPRRAGVMERLSMIELSQVDTRHEVEEIKRKVEGAK